MVDNKKIAKNTLYMYVRMIFVMAISLYTSRVVLNTLGVDDYGTYQVVGGIVGLLAFLNLTLNQGTSRFLMFELGKGDKGRLKDMFSTLLSTHILLAIIVVVLAETIGLWFVYNKLIIPAERLSAAVFAYHLSILTAFFTLTQTPYSASIISHERFDIYAYASLFDVVAKLGIVYFLAYSPIDKLEFYAILLCAEQIGMNLFYRFFCIRRFPETHYKLFFDKGIFKEVVGYTSWNLFSNTAGATNTQGMTILVNMFYNAGVVTSIAVATTVKNAANSFVENFRLAAVPQIIKSYAGDRQDESKSLLLNSTKYCFFLLFTLGFPIILVAPELLGLWLGFIPEHSVIFLRVIIISSMFQIFVDSFYTILNARGQIKGYSLMYSGVMFLNLPIVYVLFRLGFPPYALVFVLLASYMLLSMLLLPILIVRITDYNYTEILRLFGVCFSVSLFAMVIPILLWYNCEFASSFIKLLILSSVSVASTGLGVWLIGIDKEMRNKIREKLKQISHRS